MEAVMLLPEFFSVMLGFLFRKEVRDLQKAGTARKHKNHKYRGNVDGRKSSESGATARGSQAGGI